jgi:hypothetical protein
MFTLNSVLDEKQGWAKIQQLRADFSPDLLKGVEVDSLEMALKRGITIVSRVFAAAKECGIDLNNVDPGHSVGHWTRDLVNALRLFPSLDLPPATIFIGFVGAVLHDIGNTVVERYTESSRAVRHADAAALLLEYLWETDPVGLNPSEQTLIKYACAAHTHYLKPSEVKCSDGETRLIEPYCDMDGDQPIYAMWLPRWIDRLDTNGPAFVGRHYLTLVKPHKDYAPDGFYQINFTDHLKPLVREKPEGSRTMAEHLLMFANSQNNGSPYGRHDLPAMQAIRDQYKARLFRIVDAVKTFPALSVDEEKKILECYSSFLGTNIEPTELGRHAAETLAEKFVELDDSSRWAWLNGFRQSMVEYVGWSSEVLGELKASSVAQLTLPLLGNVVDTIAPRGWLEVL